MPFEFSYRERPNWPPLAWIACCRREDRQVLVTHGSDVETGAEWFGEIVWDGDYADAGFDRTDVVFGSACRQDEDRLRFVSSATVLDRLVWLEAGETTWVSNSLPCLLSEVDAAIAPRYPHYARDFRQIVEGPDSYRHPLHTSRGMVRLTYYHNLVWDGRQLTESRKPQIQRDRSTLAAYREFLETVVCRCAENFRAPQRRWQGELLGTISSGFDSPTVTALAKAAGLQQVFTIDSSREGVPDSGAEIARQLGVEVHSVDRDQWQSIPLSEVPFLSADAKGEDVYFCGAEHLLSRHLVLSGFCGSLWGGRLAQYIDLKRTDQSGLSLTEYRLWAGFIHLPLPAVGAYKAQDVLELMGSDEVQRWRSGRRYDKPFCRYVLSEAGVSSELYGQEKKAASVLIHDRASFLSDASRADFEATLAELVRTGGFQRRERISRAARRLVGAGQALARRWSSTLPLVPLERIGRSLRLSEFAQGEPRFHYLFPWALQHARKRYGANAGS